MEQTVEAEARTVIAGNPPRTGTTYDANTMTPDVARHHFPVLTQQVHGKPLVFLDSAASAQKPQCVIDAMTEAACTTYANVNRGAYHFSEVTTQAYEDARSKVQAYLGAEDASEIVFTKNATEAINLLAHSFGNSLAEGDEIILTQLEHHANIVPWHMLAERRGVILHFARITPDGDLDLEHLASLAGPRTRLISIAAMSNVLGTVPDLAEIIRIARQVGARTLFDAAQYAVHGPIDVRSLGCDFLVLSAHKLYGPTGIGVLYGRLALLEDLPPFLGGGDMIESVSYEKSTYAPPPIRFEAGTPPILEAIGLGAAIDFVSGFAFDTLHTHEQNLMEKLQAGLASLDWAKVYGTAARKGPVVSFAIEACHPHDVATLLNLEGIAVRAGHHCAQPLMKTLGVTGLVRASLAVYSTEADVDRLLAALPRVRSILVRH